MSLFSPAAINSAKASVQQQRDRTQVTQDDRLGHAILEGVSGSLHRIGRQYAAEAKEKARRRKVFEDGQFTTASSIELGDVSYNLSRKLTSFFRSDGQDVAPPEGFREDIGGGVALERADFFATTGKKRSYKEVTESVLDRYISERKKKAPSVEAEGRAGLRLQEGRLKALIAADLFEGKRQGLKLSNNLNTIVRAYKESIARTQGFSKDLFSTHLEGILESASVATEVDAGNVSLMVRETVKDMLGVAVAEAGVSRDNDAALRVLAAGGAQTDTVKQAMAGLPGKDKELLQRYSRAYQGAPKFKIGAPLPKNRLEYFDWALGQMSNEELEKLHLRAIRSFGLQTDRVRKELDRRVNGALSSISLLGLKDSGYRESLLQSLDVAIQDTARVYPKNLYPAEYSERVARLLVAREMVGQKHLLDNVPSTALSRYPQAGAQFLHQELDRKLPGGALAGLPVVQKAQAALQEYVKSEGTLRRTDPYTSLQRNDKQIANLESRLSVGDYATPRDRLLDQEALKAAVLRKSSQIQVAPSFLTKHDENTLRAIVDIGNLGDAYTYMRNVERKYGHEIFGQYIRPQILNIKGLGALGPVAQLGDPEAAEILLGGVLGYNALVSQKAAIGPERSAIQALNSHLSEIDKRESFVPIQNHIVDNMGHTAEAQEAIANMRVAVAKLATYYESKGEDETMATGKAVDVVQRGLGTVMEIDGRPSIIPPYVRETLSPLDIERFMNIVYDSRFVSNVMLPNMEGASVEQLTDDDRTKWHFTPEGAVPTDSHPLYQGHKVPIPAKGGGYFMIPYSQIPNILESR